MTKHWMVGALAAALAVAPAAAQTGSTTGGSEKPYATGNGSDSTRSATEPNTASGTSSGHATSGGTGSSAMDSAAGSASSAADTAGHKARAMGQQATDSTARTLAKLHDGNQAEIEAGTWMKEHAQNSKVKDFAKKMVDDHGSMDKDVMAFAQKKSIDLTSSAKPADADKAKSEHEMDRIKSMSGAEADRAYMGMMVRDHEKDVQETRDAETQAKSSGDKELASLLDKSAKKMESHLKDAQKIHQDLGQRQARQPGSSSSSGTGSGSTSDTGSSSGSGSSSGR